MENYVKIEKVGEGTYGKVYKARNTSDGKVYALKRIQMESEGIPSTATREMFILKSLKHTNIINLKEVLSTENSLYMVFDFATYDLKKYLDMYEGGLPPMLVKNFMHQLLQGLSYIHNHLIMHRDLKPQNILIDAQGHVKIADFGLSRSREFYPQALTHEVVTLWYRCPEILLGSPIYSFSVDIWSVACVFAEMSSKRPLFSGDSEIDQLFKIFQLLGTPNEKQWPKLKSLSNYKVEFPQWPPTELSLLLSSMSPSACLLLQEMLTYDPENRITAQEALAHVFFTTNDDDDVPYKHKRLTIDNINELSNIMKKVNQNYKKHSKDSVLDDDNEGFFDDSLGDIVFEDFEKKNVKKRLLGDITNSSGFYHKKMK